jgi:hypothetical protein
MILVVSVPAIALSVLTLYKKINLRFSLLINIGVYVIITLIFDLFNKNTETTIDYIWLVLLLTIIPISIIHVISYSLFKKFLKSREK